MMVTEATYQMTRQFPSEERFGMVSQMRRSSLSVPSNIAEGFRRGSPKEFRKFLGIAFGSLAELETQYLVAQRLNYLNGPELMKLFETMDHLGRMTNKLRQRLQSSTRTI